MRTSQKRGVASGTVAVMVAALVAQAGALAGESPDSTQADEASLDEVLVTGSRIRSGFDTPTPVTTATAEDLLRVAPRNIADALNQLPAFSNSLRGDVPVTAATGGQNGQNLLNLRNLGSNRNLVLLDGRRMVATNSANSVDVNLIPQALVERVDVVTGGASAAYGSDAVSGVINFILNDKFEGVKVDLGAGIASRGDLPNGKFSLVGGRAFANGRLRLIGSVEGHLESGIGADEESGRRWFDDPAGQIPNPVRGVSPSILVIPSIRSSLGAAGGLITNTALRGTRFLTGGTTAAFNYGTITGTSWQSGGDGGRPNIAFAPDQDRITLFSHGEFDLTERANLFAEVSFSNSHVLSHNFVNPLQGAANNFTIFSGNAYLPAAVQTQMTTRNIASFTMGRYMTDFPTVDIDARNRTLRGSLGVEGRFGDSTWTYDTSISRGRTKNFVAERNLANMRRLYAATDAVLGPSGGIVCRSTLSGLDPGCVPLNLFGEGAPSTEAIAYVIGDSVMELTLNQTVAVANTTGSIAAIDLGAGPLSLAMGLEYRKEEADQTSDALSQARTVLTGVRGGPASRNNQLGSFNFFNPQPFAGSFDVREGYVEVGLPLLSNRALAKAMDLNLAVRRSDYKPQGGVTTWKAGMNWQVTDEWRLRYTRSRDIRAPNLLELYNQAIQNSNNSIYNGVTTATLVISTGNPNLVPERALTETYGLIYRPQWLGGLQTSVDYYSIDISGAIGALGAQRLIDLCALGQTQFCSEVIVNNTGGATSLTVFSRQLNLSKRRVEGLDFEAAYSRPMFNGTGRARLLMNRMLESYTQAPASPPDPTLGTSQAPKWRGNLQLGYASGPWQLVLQERYISRGMMNANIILGTNDTSRNSVGAVFYTDVNGSYKMPAFGGEAEYYLSVSNLLDKDPPIDTANPTSFSNPTGQSYDRSGMYFNAGVRVRF